MFNMTSKCSIFLNPWVRSTYESDPELGQLSPPAPGNRNTIESNPPGMSLSSVPCPFRSSVPNDQELSARQDLQQELLSS